MSIGSVDRLFSLCIVAVLALPCATANAQEEPLTMFEWLLQSPYAERVEHRDRKVRAHLVGLGRINKVRGDWNPEERERVNGRVVSSTWRMTDGASSEDMFEKAAALVEKRADARLLFSCSRRGCGPSVQWANMVFGQRILYGTADSQRYAAWALGDEGASTHRVLVYASARSSDRQYMHTEIIEIARLPDGSLDSQLQQ